MRGGGRNAVSQFEARAILGGSDGEPQDALALLLDHRAKVVAHEGPVVVMHTERDELVDPSHGQRLATWAADRGRLMLFCEGNHQTIHARNRPAIALCLAGLAG